MNDWYDRHIKAMQLNGLSERTQQAYARQVRLLTEFHGKSPEKIVESELQEYFLHRKNITQWAPKSMRICYSAIKFFFVNILERNWHLFNILRAQTEHRLPAVLAREEVTRILDSVSTSHNFAFLSTVYSCGLRLQEALNLAVGDIDSSRGMIHVHRGKGAKDRYVPLPRTTLAILRSHWKTHRNPNLIFPSLGRSGKNGTTATEPMGKATVQGAFRSAKRKAGIAKQGVSVHTLRHSYATHLLEAGVNLRVIQRYLGHASIETTLVYLHLTQQGTEDASARINAIMEDIPHDH